MKKYKLTLIAAAVAFSCGAVQAEEIKVPEDLVVQTNGEKVIEAAPEGGYTHVSVKNPNYETTTLKEVITTVKKGDLVVDNSASIKLNDSAVDIDGKGIEKAIVNFGTAESKLDSVTIKANTEIADQGEYVYWLGYVNNGATLNVYANKYAQSGSNQGLMVENGAKANFNVNSFSSETRTTAIRAFGNADSKITFDTVNKFV